MQSLHSLVKNISHSFLSAAPEILHKGQCASAADMYSLGMVFTACFNGGQAVIQASHSTSNYFKLAGQVRPVTQHPQSQSAIERVPWSCCQPQYTYPGPVICLRLSLIALLKIKQKTLNTSSQHSYIV